MLQNRTQLIDEVIRSELTNRIYKMLQAIMVDVKKKILHTYNMCYSTDGFYVIPWY